ncbi:MAG TPA: hypothetical protein PKL84_15980, partial [Candidatus Hydrogenedentes bacterium]|nr:hypothetical protein [Candidatus Hydrogenedentota bacterium]
VCQRGCERVKQVRFDLQGVVMTALKFSEKTGRSRQEAAAGVTLLEAYRLCTRQSVPPEETSQAAPSPEDPRTVAAEQARVASRGA